MKYIAVLLIAGTTYLILARHAPVAQAVDAITQAATPGSNFLKRPLDRTQEVLRGARAHADDPGLK